MHFTVLVVGDDIEKKLAPFQENNMGDCPEEFLEDIYDEDGGTYRDNPNAQWDWWLLGGRWTGQVLKLKEGATGKTGEVSLIMGSAKPGVDQAKKKDIANFDEFSTHAFINADDEWVEQPYSSEDDGEYAKRLKQFKDQLGDDALISIIDCHI